LPLPFPTITARPLFDPQREELRFLPECPRLLQNFPASYPVLAWVGIQHGADSGVGSLNLLRLDTLSNTCYLLPGRPGFFAETQQPGVVVVGLDRRLMLFDLEANQLTETGISLEVDDRTLINDGLAVPGGLLFGTKHLSFAEPKAALYYWESATNQLRQVLGEQICSNGKHVTGGPDGSVLIDTDSIPKAITRYRFSGWIDGLQDKTLVCAPDSLPGFPDGMRVTANGESAVVAFYNPEATPYGRAREIRLADGEVLTEWQLPGSPRVTCPELLLLNGRVQAIFTTAVEGMNSELRAQCPDAGTLFIADAPFSQAPPPPPLVDVTLLSR
jgi:sugar lactone lactonase YvrE